MGLFNLFHDSTTATGEQTWYWTGGNAIENVAYSEDFPEFVWRWFTTGGEIPNTCLLNAIHLGVKQTLDDGLMNVVYGRFVFCKFRDQFQVQIMLSLHM
jgi:hypothetical protein